VAHTGSESSGVLLTLDRGIKVLEEIARGDGLATAKSLGSSLNINLGTMYQLIRTLQGNGYIHRLPGGRYHLGPRIGFLIDHYEVQTALPQTILDHLHELQRATDETVYASLAQGSTIAIVAAKEGTQRVRVGKSTIGYSAFPHARASGKVFLAFVEPDDLDDYFEDRNLERLTENTITDWGQLLTEFKVIRGRGLSFDREEFDKGISCIAAVVLGSGGEPFGAYAASLPVGRFESDRDSVAVALLKAAEAASRDLGYQGDYPPEATA
jgi:IclR family acetate operon transcriptional repressor